ncbi:MAG: hypothetical protein M1812_004651 [Candelaria pacifica]|nr:MAG: hypothetical protein M1812_004651 [Candelaria pacifica]
MSSTASQNITTLDAKLKDLINSLETHSGFTSSPQNKTVYFMHDFVTRSKTMLNALDTSKLDAGDRGTKKALQDIHGRCMFAKLMITDTTGKTAMMTGGDPSKPLDFGDEIRGRVEAVTATEAWSMAFGDK